MCPWSSLSCELHIWMLTNSSMNVKTAHVHDFFCCILQEPLVSSRRPMNLSVTYNCKPCVSFCLECIILLNNVFISSDIPNEETIHTVKIFTLWRAVTLHFLQLKEMPWYTPPSFLIILYLCLLLSPPPVSVRLLNAKGRGPADRLSWPAWGQRG